MNINKMDKNYNKNNLSNSNTESIPAVSVSNSEKSTFNGGIDCKMEDVERFDSGEYDVCSLCGVVECRSELDLYCCTKCKKSTELICENCIHNSDFNTVKDIFPRVFRYMNTVKRNIKECSNKDEKVNLDDLHRIYSIPDITLDSIYYKSYEIHHSTAPPIYNGDNDTKYNIDENTGLVLDTNTDYYEFNRDHPDDIITPEEIAKREKYNYELYNATEYKEKINISIDKSIIEASYLSVVADSSLSNSDLSFNTCIGIYFLKKFLCKICVNDMNYYCPIHESFCDFNNDPADVLFYDHYKYECPNVHNTMKWYMEEI